jgi:hypothetical protein
MLNQDKHDGSAGGVTNQENNQGKITIASKDFNKQTTYSNKKNIVNSTVGLKISDKQSNANEEIQTSPAKVNSDNKVISKNSYGAVDSNVHINIENKKNTRDKSFDSNKSAKNSRGQSKERSNSKHARPLNSKDKTVVQKTPFAKKQVKFITESKQGPVDDTLLNNENPTEGSAKFNSNLTPNIPTGKTTEKKTLKSEMKKDTLHQRTNTMYTNLIVDSKGIGKAEDNKKPGLTGIADALVIYRNNY